MKIKIELEENHVRLIMNLLNISDPTGVYGARAISDGIGAQYNEGKQNEKKSSGGSAAGSKHRKR